MCTSRAEALKNETFIALPLAFNVQRMFNLRLIVGTAVLCIVNDLDWRELTISSSELGAAGQEALDSQRRTPISVRSSGKVE
jgi:hypothetical protein